MSLFFIFKQTFYSQLYAKSSWLKILVKLSINLFSCASGSEQANACLPITPRYLDSGASLCSLSPYEAFSHTQRPSWVVLVISL